MFKKYVFSKCVMFKKIGILIMLLQCFMNAFKWLAILIKFLALKFEKLNNDYNCFGFYQCDNTF